MSVSKDFQNADVWSYKAKVRRDLDFSFVKTVNRTSLITTQIIALTAVALVASTALPIIPAALLYFWPILTKITTSETNKAAELALREREIIDANWKTMSSDWKQLRWYLQQEEITKDLRSRGCKADNLARFPSFDTCPRGVKRSA